MFCPAVLFLSLIFTAAPPQPASDIEEAPVVLLPPPSFAGSPRLPVRPPLQTRLVLVSERPNKVTDEPAWFTRNGLQMPLYESPNANNNRGDNARNAVVLPPDFRGAPLQQTIIPAEGGALLIYGAGEFGTGGRYVFGFDPKNSTIRYGFDFDRFAYPTAADRKTDRNGIGFTRQNVTWAEEQNGVLYVATGYNGYARESNNRNAYLTAVNIADGRILWRSPPLVASARNFLVTGDVIVSGYGFTKEKDTLFLLDRRTGRIVQRVSLKSAAEIILKGKADRIHVRCYDTDYVFRLTD